MVTELTGPADGLWKSPGPLYTVNNKRKTADATRAEGAVTCREGLGCLPTGKN